MNYIQLKFEKEDELKKLASKFLLKEGVDINPVDIYQWAESTKRAVEFLGPLGVLLVKQDNIPVPDEYEYLEVYQGSLDNYVLNAVKTWYDDDHELKFSRTPLIEYNGHTSNGDGEGVIYHN